MAISVKKQASYDRWRRRLDNSKRAAGAQKTEIWDRLEDALRGEFPPLMDGVPSSKEGKGKRLLVEQINDNLLLWAATYYEAISYVEFPEFRYARDLTVDKDVIEDNQTVAAKLFDEGDGMYAAARAMRSSMTRGPFCLWVDVEDEDKTPEEIINAALSASDFTDAALANPTEPIEIPEGAPYDAIAAAADALLSDPNVSLGYEDDQLNALRVLADTAKALEATALKGPHPVSGKKKIKFTAYPYGTWLWWDVSVTDLRRIGWICRQLVFSPEMFLASDRFNAAAKEYVRQKYNPENLGDSQGSGDTGRTRAAGEELDSRERVIVYEFWDRINWKRPCMVDGFDQWAHSSDKYPFLGKDGRPVLRDFFPCALVVPIKINSEDADSMTGMPLLEPGWPHQIEHIKVSSAYVQATKRSARQAIFANGLENDFITKVMQGPDGSGVPLPASYDASKHGPPVTKLDWSPAPIDYLSADAQIIKRFCTSVHIAELTMTSESPNPNLGQDKLAMAGADTMQGMILRCYEHGTAMAAEIGLTLFRSFSSTEEITSYLGPGSDYREPITQVGIDASTGLAGPVPVMVPNPETGQPEQATKPSRVDKFRAISLDRERLSCRFSVNVQGDSMARVVQMQNYIALNNSTLDPTTGTPYKDPGSLLSELADLQEIHGVQDFPPEKKAMMAQMAQTPPDDGDGSDAESQGEDAGEAPGGGRKDGRKAGGQRGPPGIPNKQERERGPQTGEQMDGIANRRNAFPR